MFILRLISQILRERGTTWDKKIIINIKREILNNALETSMGNKTKAAKRLGISRYKFIREEKKINKV